MKTLRQQLHDSFPNIHRYTLPDSEVSFEMVYIQGGTFIMGDGSHSDNLPSAPITLSPYMLGRTPVTQELYEAVMGQNPSRFVGKNKPVEKVTWLDAVIFCNALSKKLGFQPVYNITTIKSDNDERIAKSVVQLISSANGFCLPFEAQWTFAAASSITFNFNTSDNSQNDLLKNFYSTKYYDFSGSSILHSVGWYNDNANDETRDVATKLPNSLGIYDMSGNVREWCWDLFGEIKSDKKAYYHILDIGNFFINKGGGWNDSIVRCSLFASHYSPSPLDHSHFGIRLLKL